MEKVYAELRRIAGFHMRRERADHTLQATALVHEAYMILARRSNVDWNDRGEVVAMAVTAMRHYLIDHARKKNAQRNGGGKDIKRPLNDVFAYSFTDYSNLIAIDRALEELAATAPQKAKVMELRLFGGYSEAEIAALVGRDERTVQRYWKDAQEHLRDRLGKVG